MIAWITSVVLVATSLGAVAQANTIVVGAIVSQSGAHAAAGEAARQALELWQEETNAAGGLLGRRIELRVADDGSEATRAGRVCAELIAAGVDVLIGPYGTAATLAAAAEAEAARRILLNAGGRSAEVHKRAPRYVLQTVAPYAATAQAVVSAARQENAASLYVLYRDDAGSEEMAQAAEALAKSLGLRVQLERYSGSTADFLPQLYRAMAAQADAWIAFGEARDAADMVKTFKRQGFAPRLFYARKSAAARFIELVGQDAEFVLGSQEYDARFATPGNGAFVSAFKAKWGRAPDAAAATVYAAASVLAHAVRASGTLDSERLRQALARLEADTVLGRYRVDPANGMQTGMKPVLTQIVRGRAAPVWPRELAGAGTVAAFASWSERQRLR